MDVVGGCVKGHYGEVLKGQYTDENGRVQDVAIKRLKQTMYEKFATEFEKEFSIMVQLQHPHIVCIIGQSVERALSRRLTSQRHLLLSVGGANVLTFCSRSD